MGSGQVNASQLMASFLGSQNEKIGQAIAGNGFAGELEKFIPKSGSGAEPSAGDAAATPGKVNAAAPGKVASSANAPAAPSITKNAPSCSTPKQHAADSRAKINAIKSKVQKEQSIFVKDPTITETVLADLRYPAETRKACKDIQNKDGSISIKDLKSLLDTQPANRPGVNAQVPAEHVRALVKSIIIKDSGPNGKKLESGVNLNSPVQVKTQGSYSPDEFRGLLEKVLQNADTTPDQPARQGIRTSFTENAPGKTTGTATGTADAAQAPKVSQTERLTETVLPSFISSSGENDLGSRILAENLNSPQAAAQGAKVQDIRGIPEKYLENVSNNLKSGEPLCADVAEGAGREGAAPGLEAALKGGASSSSPGSASTSATAGQERVGMPVGDLNPILKQFDAKIVSILPQPVLKADEDPSAGRPDQSPAVQAPGLSNLVKGAEKQADSSAGESKTWKLSQDLAENSVDGPIKADSAQNLSDQSSSNGSSSDNSTNNEASDSAQKAQARALPTELDPGQLQVQVRQTFRGMQSDLAPAESLAGKLTQNAGMQNEKIESAVVGDAPVEAGGKTADQSGSPGVSSNFDYSIENLLSRADPSSSAGVANSGQSLQEGESATAADTLKAVDNRVAIGEQDSVMAATRIEKQSGSSDSALGGAIFQGTASSLSGSEINMPQMDNSAHGSFASYDPNRTAELVQDMREQLTGIPGGQLVIEMEPEGLGKINIKVGAKKGEISVEAMTQSAPAREVLMKHSPELRQDLKDQGLVLEKFMVDVNQDKSGDGNYPEAYKPGGKTALPPKVARVRNVQAADTPVYTTKKADRSQISIFA